MAPGRYRGQIHPLDRPLTKTKDSVDIIQIIIIGVATNILPYQKNKGYGTIFLDVF